MDLSTVANVKAYLAITNNNQDALIAALVRRESAAIENYCSRQFRGLVTRLGKRFNGSGSRQMVLPDTPIVSVTALSVDGDAIPASDGTSAGYLFDEAAIYLIGSAYRFTKGLQNVVVSWTAGWAASETGVIPDGDAPILTPTYGGLPLQAAGVVDADTSVAFAATSGTPGAGQYAFSQAQFTFAAADKGRNVTMSYYVVPEPVQQACIEMVGLDLKQRDNLGVQSKSLGGETISYSTRGLTDSVKEMLNPFRRVAPV